MTNRNYAAIDLGSNSCRLLICNECGDTLLAENYSTRLAEGMRQAGGCIAPEAFARAKDAFVKIKKSLDDFEVDEKNLRAITTAACRMAKNGQDFIAEIEKCSGIRLEVIDGKEEAQLNMQGAAEHIKEKTPYLIIWDIGGGSTEVTLAYNKTKPELIKTISIPYGARNGAEEFGLQEYDERKVLALRQKIDEYLGAFLATVTMPKIEDISFVATSSTALRMAAMIKKKAKYVREEEDGQIITQKAMNGVISELCGKSVAEMASNPCIGESRAPIFMAAVEIFAQIVQRLNADNITASLKSAKDAIIVELIERDKNNGKIN